MSSLMTLYATIERNPFLAADTRAEARRRLHSMQAEELGSALDDLFGGFTSAFSEVRKPRDRMTGNSRPYTGRNPWGQ